MSYVIQFIYFILLILFHHCNILFHFLMFIYLSFYYFISLTLCQFYFVIYIFNIPYFLYTLYLILFCLHQSPCVVFCLFQGLLWVSLALSSLHLRYSWLVIHYIRSPTLCITGWWSVSLNTKRPYSLCFILNMWL